MNKISEAESKIANILKQLEIDTGEVVKSIGCKSTEITKMEDDRQQFLMRVVIETERQPGRNWA